MSEDCIAGSCARSSFEETQRELDPEVAFTAIYSRRDGIVDWRACIDPEAHAVEVRASHTGMALDPRVVDVVTDALLLPAYAGRPGLRPVRDSVLEVDSGESA
jgi:hypothetical protein